MQDASERDRRMRLLDQEALDFLAQIAQVLVEEPDVERGMSALMEQVNAYLHTEAMSIFARDESRDVLVVQHTAGPLGQAILGLEIPIGQGVVGWVAKYNDPLIVPSTDLDPRFYSGVDARTGFFTRSILCVPIVREDQILGVIEVINKTTGHFRDDDITILEEVARLIVTFGPGFAS